MTAMVKVRNGSKADAHILKFVTPDLIRGLPACSAQEKRRIPDQVWDDGAAAG